MIPIELRQLEYFLAVSKELHFTKAAEKLNISQPSLSQQIRALEHEVGMPLFDRIGKKISLTEAGKILLLHSKNIFS
ncbi:LysR family transcriptional regulator [Bacillus pacificus]